MNNEKNEYTIWLNGQGIPVSEKVYQEFMRYERKERYFMEDLKTERIVIDQQTDTVTTIPSREDSYERLLDMNKQFSASGESACDAAIRNYLMERLERALHTLSKEELLLIQELFYLDKTERDVAALFKITQNTVNYRKRRVLAKLRKLIEK